MCKRNSNSITLHNTTQTLATKQKSCTHMIPSSSEYEKGAAKNHTYTHTHTYTHIHTYTTNSIIHQFNSIQFNSIQILLLFVCNTRANKKNKKKKTETKQTEKEKKGETNAKKNKTHMHAVHTCMGDCMIHILTKKTKTKKITKTHFHDWKELHAM
jgi:short subunit fatty acids transporter